jgi:hypothetical protein
MENTEERIENKTRYTEEEYKVLNDKEYDAIGEQLGLDAWLWACIIGLVLVGMCVIAFLIGYGVWELWKTICTWL